MAKPTAFEIELIQKITRATIALEALRKKHSDACPVNDPLISGRCTCGADENNAKVSAIISDLHIE